MEEKKSKIDYRHFICLGITVIFVALGVCLFPNAICRLLEAGCDLLLSVAYYFCEMFGLSGAITTTVNEYPSWQITESPFAPLTLLPFTWEEFQVWWSDYWARFATMETLEAYLYYLCDVLYYVSQGLLILLTVAIPLYFLFQTYLMQKNTDRAKDSKALIFCKKIYDRTIRRVIKWAMEFKSFLAVKTAYKKLWLWMWLFYFNIITIVIEFFAFYFYFVFSFDFLSIYRQIYKLLLDLTAMIRFIPGVIWAMIIILFLEKLAEKAGLAELRHRERRNRGFLNERSIVTIFYGTMGVGKTATITDAALSAEVELRDRAFEIIVECDFCFPYFPWINLEHELKIATAFHVCYDLASVRRWVRKKYRRWAKEPTKDRIFGYDYERYGLTHDDKLKVEDVWQVIEDYACAYLVYAVQCSLIISNYSIRSDNLLADEGNFPMWDNDFFTRDSKMMEAYSRRSHVLDFDMLRFGKRVLKDNPNAHALGFGVYVFTELDKERKNDQELRTQGVKGTDEEANQKNDLFNSLLKMIRHAVMIRNRVMIICLGDLQRPEDWGANGRDVGEIAFIAEKGEMVTLLPFWAPFWWFAAFYELIFAPFVDLYYSYRFSRADNTVPMHFVHGLMAKIKDAYQGIVNTFASSKRTLEVESGRMDRAALVRYYFLSKKKAYAERYGTDCLSAIFERYSLLNTVGIMDMATYADKMASDAELQMQHSYFQRDLMSMRAA